MELSAPSQLGVHPPLSVDRPKNERSEDTRVNPNDRSGKSGADPSRLSQNAKNAALARLSKRQFTKAFDPDPPAGPPPSFEISLLEEKQDLKKEIARMEAARRHLEDVQAVQVAQEYKVDLDLE